MKALGKIICGILGRHKERRIKQEAMALDSSIYNRRCTRCGATRLARKRKSPTKGIQ